MSRIRNIGLVFSVFFAVILIIGGFLIISRYISGAIDIAIEEERRAYDFLKTSTTTPVAIVRATSTTPEDHQEQPAKPEEKSLIAIQILNSTGITGKAADLATKLSNSGFKIIATGNATKKEQITQFQVKESIKKGLPASVSEIEKILARSYKITSTPLTNSADYDIVIVIGME